MKAIFLVSCKSTFDARSQIIQDLFICLFLIFECVVGVWIDQERFPFVYFLDFHCKLGSVFLVFFFFLCGLFSIREYVYVVVHIVPFLRGTYFPLHLMESLSILDQIQLFYFIWCSEMSIKWPRYFPRNRGIENCRKHPTPAKEWGPAKRVQFSDKFPSLLGLRNWTLPIFGI